jgi:hypothetical protein
MASCIAVPLILKGKMPKNRPLIFEFSCSALSMVLRRLRLEASLMVGRAAVQTSGAARRDQVVRKTGSQLQT